MLRMRFSVGLPCCVGSLLAVATLLPAWAQRTNAPAPVAPDQSSLKTARKTTPDSEPAIRTVSLPVLPPQQMSAEDAALLQSREAEVSQAAAFFGFDISNPDWTYRQIVCRTLPGYLLLGFRNQNGPHGASHFTAVVPRQQGKVEVVTSYAHGFSMFKPAWTNPGSIAVFNRMVARERGEAPIRPDDHWLNLGMCYAALTGPPPEVAAMQDDVAGSQALAQRQALAPIIHVGQRGEAELGFSDLRDPDATHIWSLRFDPSGALKRAERTDARPIKIQHSAILEPASIRP